MSQHGIGHRRRHAKARPEGLDGPRHDVLGRCQLQLGAGDLGQPAQLLGRAPRDVASQLEVDDSHGATLC
jgi:hypothetical protein